MAITAAGLAASGAAEAKAKSKKAAQPTVKRVSPMRVKVGRKITIRGTGFSSSRKRNTVIFKGAAGRSTLAKPSRASHTKLVLTVPAATERILTKKAAAGVPTRITLRVVTKRYGKASIRRHSPIVVSALKSGKTAACGKGSDWDGDLLPNAVELKYALDPCKADSDGDGMTDGWEYWSAKDLNVRAVPYPGKKPYPNPLDASDPGIDFDGDALQAKEEYRAWVVSGKAFNESDPSTPLGYSDGTQSSRPGDRPGAPDTDGDGRYTDDERDADGDGLNNYIETHGPGRAAWWTSVLTKLSVEPWPGTDPGTKYSYYGAFAQRPFADTELDDPDVDGDGVLDGADDQDSDDISNAAEMYDPLGNYANGFKKNAFNPCAPVTNSRTCPRYFPTG